MKYIHIDRPSSAQISCTQVFEGWAVSDDSLDQLEIKVNDTTIRYHAVQRPDVVAAYPELNTVSFMFFLEASRGLSEYTVDFVIGSVKRSINVELSGEELEKFELLSGVIARHQRFLRSILVCPQCHKPIDLVAKYLTGWQCDGCGEEYDFSNGLDLIPASYAGKAEIRFQGAICSHGYDEEVAGIVQRVAEEGGMILDCGAGWRHDVHENVIALEILKYPSTDVVSLGEALPFADNSFDAVLSLHVLEHVKNPFTCARELVRVLKPNRTIFAVTPYISQIHGFPFHFFNPTPFGLKALFEAEIEEIDIAVPVVAHPLVALRELLSAYSHFFDSEGINLFRSTTIGRFLDFDINEILGGELMRHFDERGKDYLSGNFRLIGKKRLG